MASDNATKGDISLLLGLEQRHFYGFILILPKENKTSRRRNSDLTCYFYENGKHSLFMHFFLTVHLPNSVRPIYLTSHALCGLSWKKRILETQGKVLSTYIQPNLWTVLIANFFWFLFFRKDFLFNSTK